MRCHGPGGEGKAGRWFSTIELHVLPKLGKMPIEEIDQLDVQKVLAPIWHTKADTARKAANRLKIILKHAKAMRIDVNLMAVDEAKVLLGKSKQKRAKKPSVAGATCQISTVRFQNRASPSWLCDC